MCDYSTEHLNSKAVKVGDKLVISSVTHGFATAKSDKAVYNRITAGKPYEDVVCLACLKENGTVLELTTNQPTQSPMLHGHVPPGTYRAVYSRLKHPGFGYKDTLSIEGHGTILIAYLQRGQTTARVVSIPSVTKKRLAASKKRREAARAKKLSLESKLGLDTLNARVTTAAEPAKVKAAYRRVSAAKKRVASKA